MDELLAYLMAAAVQLSGLPALAERPPVTPMPYQKMLVEICADLKEESVRMLAQYDLCTHGQSVADKNCEALKPDLKLSQAEMTRLLREIARGERP